MKKTLIATAAILSFNANAGMPCKDMHDVSVMIMEARQAGVSVTESIENLEKYGFEFMTGIALLAYEKPRYSTESMKQRSVTEFGNMIYIGCKKQEKPQNQPDE